jgi:ubiquinone/menaquinone biosynthesis C-methylase UbiE
MVPRMGIFSVFGDPRSGYSSLEALAFDRLFIRIAGPLHDAALIELEPVIRSGMRILDVGCGGGQFALLLADRFADIELIGVDLSPDQVGRARRRASGRAGLSFVVGSALDLPFAANTFDLVYSVGSLKHWSNPELGLRECARVAKPGGRLFVMEGDRGCRHEDLLELGAAWGLPTRMRPLLAAFFRVAVAGESLDLVDARELLAQVQEIEGGVERITRLPAWAITGQRR